VQVGSSFMSLMYSSLCVCVCVCVFVVCVCVCVRARHQILFLIVQDSDHLVCMLCVFV
jgi:hypothetical protein